MSLPTEIQRLQNNVNGIVSDTHAILDAIAAKGVAVPEGSTLHDCPSLIGGIRGSANYLYYSDFSNFDLSAKIDYPKIGKPITFPQQMSYSKVQSNTRQFASSVETLDYTYNIDGGLSPLIFSGLDWSRSKKIKTIFCNKQKNGYCVFQVYMVDIIKRDFGFSSFGTTAGTVCCSENQTGVSLYNGSTLYNTSYNNNWYSNPNFTFSVWNTYEIIIDVKAKKAFALCNGIVMLSIGFTTVPTNEDLCVPIAANGNGGNYSINSMAILSIEDIDT